MNNHKNSGPAPQAAVQEGVAVESARKRNAFLQGVDTVVESGFRIMDNKKQKWLVFGILFLAMATVPLYANNYVLDVIWNAMFYMLLCMGLNVIVGYCGLCDLGFAAKFAVGAYTAGILVKTFAWNFWLTIPIVIITSIIAACIIGGPTLRLRSDYLAIVTLGFGEITRIVARNLEITGSASGLSGIPKPTILGISLSGSNGGVYWFYIFLLLVILFVIISNRIKNSRFGRALEYIREDEDAAQAMGIDTTRYKLWAYIMGSIMGGLAGAFYAVKMAAVSPTSFTFTQSANILLAVVLGGMGKIPGVVLGAAFFSVFPEIFRTIGEYRMLIFGVLLVLVMIFRPQGLWPERRR